MNKNFKVKFNLEFILKMFNVSFLLSYCRTVQPELKSLAMGFHSLIIRTLGMINMSNSVNKYP